MIDLHKAHSDLENAFLNAANLSYKYRHIPQILNAFYNLESIYKQYVIWYNCKDLYEIYKIRVRVRYKLRLFTKELERLL